MPYFISKEVSRMYPVRYIEKVNNLYENIEIMFVYTGGGYAYSASNCTIIASEKNIPHRYAKMRLPRAAVLFSRIFYAGRTTAPISPICPF